MRTFYIIERQACEVMWRYPVEAETSEEAFEKYGNGEHGAPEGPTIGDSIDEYQYDLDIYDLDIEEPKQHPDTAAEEGCRYERAFGDRSDLG